MTVKRAFVVSDTHFGHQGVCEFLHCPGGPKIRPWTDSATMDEDMVRMWNETVRPEDKVYHLGDVAIPRKGLEVVGRLNGRKILIKGNHDIFKITDYLKYFDDIRAYHVVNNIILSHIPVHDGSKGRFNGNIHGHTHSNRVTDKNGLVDPWYYSVSVEHTGFKPILLDDAFKFLKSQHYEVPV